MLILIHGDQIELSRNKLNELKLSAKGKTIRELDGTHLDSNILTQALESSSLFGSDVLVIIERFIGTAKKREKAFTFTLSQIQEACKSKDIILYEEKEVEKSALSKLGPHVTTYLYKTPAIIFQLLDNLRPSNAKESIILLSRVISKTPIEIVFALLARRVRQLIQQKNHVTPEGLQAWQADRLTAQARHFTMEQLIAMHTHLLDIEIAIKTGKSPFTLTQHIELLFVSL